jgi:hypothetical protein
MLNDEPKRKAPDSCFRPKRTTLKRKKNSSCSSPSVVIEVAFGQKSSDLEHVARRWLLGSEGKVKAVIAVDVVEKKGRDPRIDGLGGEDAVEKLEGNQWIEWLQTPETLAPYSGNALALVNLLLEHHDDGTLWLTKSVFFGEMTATFYVYRRTPDGGNIEVVWKSLFWSTDPTNCVTASDVCNEITTIDLIGNEDPQGVPLKPVTIPMETLRAGMPDLCEEHKEFRAYEIATRLIEEHGLELGPFREIPNLADLKKYRRSPTPEEVSPADLTSSFEDRPYKKQTVVLSNI